MGSKSSYFEFTSSVKTKGYRQMECSSKSCGIVSVGAVVCVLVVWCCYVWSRVHSLPGNELLIDLISSFSQLYHITVKNTTHMHARHTTHTHAHTRETEIVCERDVRGKKMCE